MMISGGWMGSIGWKDRRPEPSAVPGPPAYPALPALPAYPAVPLLDLRRLSHDALQRPTLASAERTRFHDLEGISGFRHAVLIVHHEGGRSALGLAIHPVPDLPLHRDDNALLHLVADDDADLFGLL